MRDKHGYERTASRPWSVDLCTVLFVNQFLGSRSIVYRYFVPTPSIMNDEAATCVPNRTQMFVDTQIRL